jgi:HAD superfamily hydrolase (TIGR01509 family)
LAIKAVIFDLDGTIIHFNLNYKAVRAEVIQFLTKQGFPQSIFSMNESVFEMMKKMEIYMKNNGKRKQEIMKTKKAVFSLVSSHELEAARSTRLIPGVLETLKALRKKGLKMALFTLNGEKSVSYILKCFRLESFFDTVITRDFGSAVKPDSAHLEAVLGKLNVKPEEGIVVGDSVWDMMCAHELNVIAIGVVTGISSLQELTRAGATYIASSFTELPTLIQQLNKS